MENEAKETKKQGRLFIISAPSGAGKSTLIKAILKDFPLIKYSISHTTRKPRKGENEGIEYFFIGKEEFKKMIEKNLWAEWAEVHDNYYGTSIKYIEDNINSGTNILLDLDVQGAINLMKKYPDSITIFIMPPSMEELKRRLESRGTDTPETIAKRLFNAKEEISHKDLYSHIIINDDLNESIKKITSVVNSYLQLNV
ncbi:MAG: guanylate kinase [Desulfobacterales bacterium]|nr:guanylate kinase [Desulfobacterales bacterium]